MNLEEIENLWNAQQPASTPRHDPAELTRQLEPEFRQRGRFFAYQFFTLGLGLVLMPVLAVANYRYQPPLNPFLHGLHLVLFFVMALGVLVAAVRRLRRHRALMQARADTLTGAAAKALASIEIEMKDYRLAAWTFFLWFGITLLSIYVNNPVSVHGWERFLRPLALASTLIAVIGSVGWRHYAVNLRPEYARRKRLLAELAE